MPLLVVPVVADHGRVVTFLVTLFVAMIADRRGATARAPTPLDPDVAVATTLPPTLLPHVPGALALPVPVTPDPLATAAHPASFDEDEARAGFDDNRRARRRRLLVDFDDRDWDADPAVGADDTTG
jgi:hypothetical protein